MKMKGMKKAVSLLLAAALVVTLFSGQGTMLAAKKSGKTKAKVSSVKITNTGKKLRLQKGKKFRLKTSVKVKPNNSKNKKLKFTSSNRKVVLVNSRGLLKGLRVGTAKITAASKLNPKKKASLSVSVTKDVLVTNIKLNKTKITADEFNENEIPLKVTKILPSNAKNKKVIWSTDDESVADVDDSGVVTTGDVGTTTITATAADEGGAYATCRVTVVENSSRGDDADVTEQPVDVTQKPPVQEEPGEVTAEPTEEPEEETTPKPVKTSEPEKTASPAPGDVTAEPETDAPGEVTAEPTEEPKEETTSKPAKTSKPTETFEPVSYELSNPTVDGNGTTTWDCVYFGNYWQNDTNGDGKADKDDRKQPIKWRVLSVDGDDAFLLADKNIDAQSYNDTYTDVTWETCTMRSWLNGYGAKMNQSGKDYSGGGFIDHAFSADERSAIKTVSVVNNDNPEYGTEGGNDTSDKVYLLSIKEATNPAYGFVLNSNECAKSRRVKNTKYAKAQGASAWSSMPDECADNGVWWLRSPGDNSNCASTVNSDGYVYRHGNYVYYDFWAVRPALHLNLSSASNWTYAGTVSSEDRKPVTKPEGTPDPFVPEGEGWQKLDLSRWSGNSDNYSEEGNLVLLDGVEFETIPLPEILENIGDKMEIIVRGSVSEDSRGFRFWMTNAVHYTMSQQYHYTEQYGVGLREADMELDVDGTAGEFHPGESFQLQTVLENVNWDGNDDPVCTNLMLKGPAYGEYVEGIIITGIWVRYGDAIGTTPDVSPTPAEGTPTPEPFVPGVETGVVEHGLNNPMIGDDGSTTWDCVYFGNYWQNDTNGDGIADTDDEKQPIKWRVLSVDGDDALLVADENLDSQPYNRELMEVTWETSMLRSWLNDDFFTQAFTAGEQSAVKKTVIVNKDNTVYGAEGGEDTEDYVYLLSEEEVRNRAYGFSAGTSIHPAREARNTAYAKTQGVKTGPSEKYKDNGVWWLRSPGNSRTSAIFVNYYGLQFQAGTGVDDSRQGIRPALHLKLSSASDWSYAGTVTSEQREPAPKPEGTPDPFVPEGEGWQRLDLSRWSGYYNDDGYYYSEEGNMVLLDNVELLTVSLPEILENMGDKMEIIVRGSVSENSTGFRFWMTNARLATISQPYYYTKQYGVGLREVGMELDVDGTAGEFHPGESFQLQTVLENVNWDFSADPVCRNLMFKAPSYGECMEGVTITGIWVRYGDAIGTTPDVSPTPAGGTPTPDPFVPGVETSAVESSIIEYGLSNPKIDDNGITTWDCVYFGNYWQNDTNGDGIADEDDEKQPIKWRVPSVNGDDAFLLSDENLDCQPYNDEWTDVTWETCTLRSWLNDDFFTQAFTAKEQSAIWTTKVVNDDNPYFGTEGGGSLDHKTARPALHLNLSSVSSWSYAGTVTLEKE